MFCFTTEWLNCISCTFLILCIIHLGITYSNPFSFCFRVVVLISTETVSMLRFCVSIYMIMLPQNGLSDFSGTQICCRKGHFETICLFDLGLHKNLFACNHCCFLLVVSQHGCSLYLNSVQCAVFMLEVTFNFYYFIFVIRAKIKAEKEAEALLSSGPGEPRSTRSKQRKYENAVAAQRAKWREWKRKERSKWTAQHWRRHRERNLHAYYARKAPEKGTKITPVSLCVILNVMFQELLW